MKSIFTLAAILALTGCAYVRSTTTRQTAYDRTFGTNNVTVTEKTTVTGYAMLEANQSITRLKNGSSVSTVGSNSYSAGTYFSGINENASSTNAAATIDALTRLISKIAPGGF